MKKENHIFHASFNVLFDEDKNKGDMTVRDLNNGTKFSRALTEEELEIVKKVEEEEKKIIAQKSETKDSIKKAFDKFTAFYNIVLCIFESVLYENIKTAIDTSKQVAAIKAKLTIYKEYYEGILSKDTRGLYFYSKRTRGLNFINFCRVTYHFFDAKVFDGYRYNGRKFSASAFADILARKLEGTYKIKKSSIIDYMETPSPNFTFEKKLNYKKRGGEKEKKKKTFY